MTVRAGVLESDMLWWVGTLSMLHTGRVGGIKSALHIWCWCPAICCIEMQSVRMGFYCSYASDRERRNFVSYFASLGKEMACTSVALALLQVETSCLAGWAVKSFLLPAVVEHFVFRLGDTWAESERCLSVFPRKCGQSQSWCCPMLYKRDRTCFPCDLVLLILEPKTVPFRSLHHCTVHITQTWTTQINLILFQRCSVQFES